MQLSYWELKNWFTNIDYTIVGSGIVGGGIVDLFGIQKAYASGADLVVIGTAFEKDFNFFNSNNQ